MDYPSGNPKPSVQDIESTKRAVEAGRIVKVEVLDHLIIGDKSYVSLKEKGVWDEEIIRITAYEWKNKQRDFTGENSCG